MLAWRLGARLQPRVPLGPPRPRSPPNQCPPAPIRLRFWQGAGRRGPATPPPPPHCLAAWAGRRPRRRGRRAPLVLATRSYEACPAPPRVGPSAAVLVLDCVTASTVKRRGRPGSGPGPALPGGAGARGAEVGLPHPARAARCPTDSVPNDMQKTGGGSDLLTQTAQAVAGTASTQDMNAIQV